MEPLSQTPTIFDDNKRLKKEIADLKQHTDKLEAMLEQKCCDEGRALEKLKLLQNVVRETDKLVTEACQRNSHFVTSPIAELLHTAREGGALESEDK